MADSSSAFQSTLPDYALSGTVAGNPRFLYLCRTRTKLLSLSVVRIYKRGNEMKAKVSKTPKRSKPLRFNAF